MKIIERMLVALVIVCGMHQTLYGDNSPTIGKITAFIQELAQENGDGDTTHMVRWLKSLAQRQGFTYRCSRSLWLSECANAGAVIDSPFVRHDKIEQLMIVMHSAQQSQRYFVAKIALGTVLAAGVTIPAVIMAHNTFEHSRSCGWT